MRHRRKGRVLGRNSSHRKALFANMVSAIFLTEREVTELEPNAPKVPGRIITTLEKAKEIRPMVEKCITIAIKGLAGEAGAVEFESKSERGSEDWKAWRAKAICGESGLTLAPLASRRVDAFMR